MPALYLTFGTQYGNLAEAAAALDAGRAMPDPHPTAEWASGRGYLVVQYTVPTDGDVTTYLDEARDARERARVAAHAWLDGCYAFDYDEPPGPEHAPLGELARMVLP